MFYIVGLVVFALELVAWGAIASFGLIWLGNSVAGWVLAAVLLILVIAFWSVFMAPKARRRLSTVPYYVAKAIIYLAAAYALWQVSPVAATVFAVVAVIAEPLFRRVETSGPEGGQSASDDRTARR